MFSISGLGKQLKSAAENFEQAGHALQARVSTVAPDMGVSLHGFSLKTPFLDFRQHSSSSNRRQRRRLLPKLKTRNSMRSHRKVELRLSLLGRPHKTMLSLAV